MYNDPYYSRRGRTIERKKTASGHVIQPELVPVYYNYFKDNGLLPAPPPAPPVHVDDGTCISVDYDNQEYSFPSSYTSLTNALGTLLDTLGIDVDITKVDHINLSFYVTSRQSNGVVLYLSTSDTSSSNGTYYIGTYNGSATSNLYTITFARDYRQSGTVFCYSGATGFTGNSGVLAAPSSNIIYIKQVDGHVYLKRIVVSSLTE